MLTLWNKFHSRLNAVRRRTLGTVLDALAARKARRDEAAFSIALIALSAKMAKADGIVTDDEIAAFRDFFHFPDEEAENVRMVYRLAQQDVAGFEHYLTRVARIFDNDPAVLEDVLDCLFHIALADGVAHPRELELLETAGAAFNLPPAVIRRLKMVHLGLGGDDPYLILDLPAEASDSQVKQAYRKLVRTHHPDALIARGVPAELVRIAENRMAAINGAYQRIVAERPNFRVSA